MKADDVLWRLKSAFNVQRKIGELPVIGSLIQAIIPDEGRFRHR